MVMGPRVRVPNRLGWWTEGALRSDTEMWVRKKNESSKDPGKERVRENEPHFPGSRGKAGRLRQREE